ncbi:MAG: 2-amino-4-hydroxy-6-hydroxymethyldihydropteridine diphosphokinase [Bacteroidetes bacterium]|uniref:2-amino-4-hydroxy-6-hydroxymethyldihydropteridine pyrophosphokinase n=1 Tax=Candidatus Enterocola intestinipullorum TaxID=2840783 RepID=A0A9D9EFK6_9BACT|nr:2-amino-4-hydroxy-6-hydroxymethyldihydropteridine diphosphokinase [Candidatus Enterocola intestinipullorum]
MKTTANVQTSQNSSRKNKVFLALGSNLGDRDALLDAAEALIGRRVGKIVAKSSRFENPAAGFKSDNDFLNEAIEVATVLSPQSLLSEINGIERCLGRERKSMACEYHDRTMDIDIIYYGDAIINEPQLVVPHPRMAERMFVLQPLNEIAPGFVHPLLHRTSSELLASLQSG